MKRFLALATMLALALVVTACGGDDGDDGATTTTSADGGADTTVSTENYVAAVDDACKETLDANSEFVLPTFENPTSPTPADFAAYATYLENTNPATEKFVETLDDMPQPSDSADAEKANELVDAFGRALAASRDLLSAAQAENLFDLQAATDRFQLAVDDYSALLTDLGVTGCNTPEAE